LTGVLFKFSFDLKKCSGFLLRFEKKTPGNAANVDLFFRFDSAGGRGDLRLFYGNDSSGYPGIARFSKDRQKWEQDACGICWLCRAKHW